MPPRPFPLPLKVGTDICHVRRIRDILTRDVCDRKPLERFLSKLMTWPERQYFWDRFKDNEAAYKDIKRVSEFLAGRWAAKEACRKACTHLGSSNGFHNIMILPVSTATSEPSPAPRALILRHMLSAYKGSPPVKEEFNKGSVTSTEQGRCYFDVDAADGQFCELSISHDNDLATAVALVPSIPDEWD